MLSVPSSANRDFAALVPHCVSAESLLNVIGFIVSIGTRWGGNILDGVKEAGKRSTIETEE